MTRFAYAGNRWACLALLLQQGQMVNPIWAVPGSWLARWCEQQGVPYRELRRQGFLTELTTATFDVLVSCGCPVLLPPAVLAMPGKRFVNLHPSALPDLRGCDPVPGALLYGRPAGATCHLIDAGMDTGPIISQEIIPTTPELDAPLLYQLCFQAEVRVLVEALARDFQPVAAQEPRREVVCYRVDPADRIVDLSLSAEVLVRRVRAFANRSQGARLLLRETELHIHAATISDNAYLLKRIDDFQDTELVCALEGRLLLRRGDRLVLFREVEPWLSVLQPGVILNELTAELSERKEQA